MQNCKQKKMDVTVGIIAVVAFTVLLLTVLAIVLLVNVTITKKIQNIIIMITYKKINANEICALIVTIKNMKMEDQNEENPNCDSACFCSFPVCL